MVVGLLGLAIAAIVRRTAGAIATLFGLVFIAPLLAESLPSPSNNDVGRFLPSSIGSGLGAALFSVHPDTNPLSPGLALVSLAVWLLLAFVVAGIVISRRGA